MERKRWSVGDLTRYIRQMFDTDYRLQDLEVEGEVSDFRIPGSGHAYFTLKDADASMRCVMWRSEVQSLAATPQRGDRVIVRGHMSVYEPQGQYQLYCHDMRPAGLGDLHAQFEALKAKLADEGLFAAERKRLLPALPRTIGIATSMSTAALQDVLNVLRRRYPFARVLIAETPVQGDGAPPHIVAALDQLNARQDVDVILLVRGGGSLEDLWCFNDEAVARSVANSRIPLVSGVGHEIDFTLADFAADVRAPTPSAAAELATPLTISDLQQTVINTRERLYTTLQGNLEERRQQIRDLETDLRRLSPQGALNTLRQRLDDLHIRASQAARGQLARKRAELSSARRVLAGLSPIQTLARGYAIVQTSEGQVVRTARQAPPDTQLYIRLYQGQLKVRVEEQDTDDD